VFADVWYCTCKTFKLIKRSAVLSRSVDLNIIIFVNFGLQFACICGLNDVFPVLRVSDNFTRDPDKTCTLGAS